MSSKEMGSASDEHKIQRKYEAFRATIPLAIYAQRFVNGSRGLNKAEHLKFNSDVCKEYYYVCVRHSSSAQRKKR